MDLQAVLAGHSRRLRRVVERAEECRFQVLLSEVHSAGPSPRLRTHSFRADAEYFYPASAIKLCGAVSALMLLRDMQREHGADPEEDQGARSSGAPDRNSEPPVTSCPPLSVAPTAPLALLPVWEGEAAREEDGSNLNGGSITLAHAIRKLLLVSDNDAFNVLFDFVGHRYLNQSMWNLGLTSAAVRHRLSVPMSEADNRVCRPVAICQEPSASSAQVFPPQASRADEPTEGAPGKERVPGEGEKADQAWACLAPKRSSLQVPAPLPEELPGQHVGRAYIDGNGERIERPMDFSHKNRISLLDLHRLLILLLRPDLLQGATETASATAPDATCRPEASPQSTAREAHINVPESSAGAGLDPTSLRCLLSAMAEYPRESHSPAYDPREYPDDYCKFFLPGLCRVRPKKCLRIYNKIGQAYGFTIDNAFVEDIETHRSFFLSMVLYTNTNGVMNDDIYEYDLAYSLAADVAEAVARALWGPQGQHSLRSNFTLPPLQAAPPAKNETPTLQSTESSSKAQNDPLAVTRDCTMRAAQAAEAPDAKTDASPVSQSTAPVSPRSVQVPSSRTLEGGAPTQANWSSSASAAEQEQTPGRTLLPCYKYFVDA